MGEIVECKADGGSVYGYLSLPAGKGPGLIVIQEWWGLVDHIKDVADRFAKEGFVALAPDLYHGRTTTEPDEAGKMMMTLQIADAARDMAVAVDYLEARDEVEPKKIGSVGFCMGGSLSITLASVRPISAAVSFYGIPAPTTEYSKITCPILIHGAEHDPGKGFEEVQSFVEDMRARGIDASAELYPGTHHAFFNDTRPKVFDAPSAERAWAKTLEFLREHLL